MGSLVLQISLGLIVCVLLVRLIIGAHHLVWRRWGWRIGLVRRDAAESVELMDRVVEDAHAAPTARIVPGVGRSVSDVEVEPERTEAVAVLDADRPTVQFPPPSTTRLAEPTSDNQPQDAQTASSSRALALRTPHGSGALPLPYEGDGATVAADDPDATPPALAWLRGVRGVAGEYVLGRRQIRIGRGSGNDITIPRTTVSRHQATLRYTDGGWVLWVHPSRNGVSVNGHPVSPEVGFVLQDADRLQFGTQVELALFVPQLPRERTAMLFRSAGRTIRGGRAENQDAFAVGELLVGVADGVGGRPAGSLAASTAINALAQISDASELARAVDMVNARLRRLGEHDPMVSGLATTLDIVGLADCFGETWVHGVHVGDGVVARQQDTDLELLTRAHTLSAELVAAGRLSTSEGREHPDRSRLLRAIGLDDVVEPDEWQRRAAIGDRYVVASDGLVGALGEDRLAVVLTSVRGSSPEDAAAALIAEAEIGGARDNVTVVIADVVAAPSDPDGAL